MNNSKSKIKVAIIDDHGMARLGLETFLHSHDDIDLVCSLADSNEFLEVVKEKKPDVAIIDLYLLRGLDEGISIIKYIKDNCSDTKIFVNTGVKNLNNFLTCIKMGIEAFVIKSADNNAVPTVYDVLIILASGKRYYDPLLIYDAIPYLKDIPENNTKEIESLHVKLTKRECEVLKLLVNDKKEKEIAESLSISVNTVKTHKQHIFDQLGVKNQTQAKSTALLLKLLNENDDPNKG